ncbi:MAG: OmpA family protein [Mycobacterium sp.]
MTGSGDARIHTSETAWRTESRYYRRSPGWGWLLGLLLIPLLFGWLGWGALKPAENSTPAGLPGMGASAPGVSLPSPNLAPLSILRNGRDFTLTGILPDLAARNGLLGSMKTALGGGVNLIDRIDIETGAKAPGFDGLGALLKAAADIEDFHLTIGGGTLTLAGTASSEDVRSEVEAAAKAGWPNLRVVDNITIRGTAPSCDNLQATVDADLAAPVKFQTESAKLTGEGRQQLSAVASAIKACPGVAITVIGHTDSTGTDAINKPLSENRARAVAAYLVAQGIPAESVTSKGAGSSDPVAGNDTAAGRAQNRRTEIKVD